MRKFILYLIIFLLFFNCYLFSEEKTPKILNLDRIFKTDEFKPEKAENIKWFKKGSFYSKLEDSDTIEDSKNIVVVNPKTGEENIVVEAKNLIPGGKEKPIKIYDYKWFDDQKKLLIFTNTKKVWRLNTKGDYWIYDLKTKKLKKLGGKAEPSSLMFAKPSPDNEKIAYVKKNNIYVKYLKTGKIKQLTFDGSENIINGTFDWVYEEEFSCRDGFRWSPDSKKIAFWQLNTEGIKDFYLINNTDTLYPKLKAIKYPKVGTTNSACKIGVISIDNGEEKWIKIPGDLRNNYIPRMSWANNSKQIIFQRMNRLQNTNKVMIGDIKSGESRIIFTEKDEAWLDVVDNVEWLNNGKEFIWLSEQDGWRHIYTVNRNGEKKCITKGEYDVIKINKIDKKRNQVYFIASPEDPTKRYLFCVSINREERLKRITPEGQGGYHQYNISDDGNYAIHTFSSYGFPPVTELVNLPEHKTLKTLVSNSKLKNNLNSLNTGKLSFFDIIIKDGVSLKGIEIKPPDFDKSKKYPVLFYVYGEPWGQTTLDRWGGKTYLWHLMLTQKGFLVITVDNRGTPMPLGREWRKSIYKKIGILNASDQAAAAKKISQWKYVDEEKIGVWGWSGGGSSTLNALFKYPKIYKTGIAVASVPDQHLYDTIYQERYMGLSEENIEAFEKGSPTNHAKNLKGNLLIIHGTGDDNVHYQGVEKLINELIKHNKNFDLMIYPNRTHSIKKGENTRRHLYGIMTEYLEEHMRNSK